MIFRTALTLEKSRSPLFDVHREFLELLKLADQVENEEQVEEEEVSILSDASDGSNNPASMNAKSEKSRFIKKPTGWNSFLKAVAVSVTFNKVFQRWFQLNA